MANAKYTLYKLVKLKSDDGSEFWRYKKAAFHFNNKIKPDVVLVNGKEERHPEGSYYLNHNNAWIAVGDDAQEAVRQRGLKLNEAERERLDGTTTKPDEVESEVGSKQSKMTRLDRAIAEYLGDIKLTKKPKTLAAYTTALTYFSECCKKTHVSDITRRDMLQFHAFLRDEKGQSPRSCWNKFSNVMSFLKAYDIRKIVKPADWPVYVEEEPEIYEPEELNAFFSVCTAQERLWFEFFLMTGMREQEVMHSMWRDVRFHAGTITVSAKQEFGWTPKAYKGRTIPVPASLLEKLASIAPGDRNGLIFSTANGQPKLDFLDRCKEIAKRAGLNSDNYWLHKFRATFATMHLQAGVDLRTVQAWCGHVDLESTLRYLKPARGAKVQQAVNSTFAELREPAKSEPNVVPITLGKTA
jgi:integrase